MRTWKATLNRVGDICSSWGSSLAHWKQGKAYLTVIDMGCVGGATSLYLRHDDSRYGRPLHHYHPYLPYLKVPTKYFLRNDTGGLVPKLFPFHVYANQDAAAVRIPQYLFTSSSLILRS